jgi:diacylglycerol kinase (ATP)
MNSSYFFIVNTRIGTNKISAAELAIEKYFGTDKYVIEKTNYGGHATQLAKDAVSNNYSHVVAIGGDGTVNEVVQVLAQSNCILGIVPCGSGNGLARHAQIPLNIDAAVKNCKDGKAELIDLGKANNVFFISNAGVGIDALVCNDIKTSKYRGLKMYAFQVSKRYFSYKPDQYAIQIDEQKAFEQQGFFLNVANGKEFGYGFQIAPEAGLQDGILDIIIVNSMNIGKGIKFVWDGWRKQLIYNKNCSYFKGKKITVRGKNLNFFQTDGDAHACNGECIFEVKEKALHLMVPVHVKNL